MTKIRNIFQYLAVITTLLLTSALLFACFGGGDKDKDGTNGDSVYDLSKLTLVAVGGSDFTYDGTEKHIAINVNDNKNPQSPTRVTSISADGNHSDIDVLYSDNVNAGTATVKVKAKSSSNKFKGENQITFTIHKAVNAEVDNLSSLNTALTSGNYYNITLVSDIEIPDGTTIRINSVTQLKIVGAKLTVYGKIENHGAIIFNDYAVAVLHGETENYGLFSVSSHSEVKNYGTFSNSGRITTSGNFTSDSDIGGIINIYDGASFTIRKELHEDNVTLEFASATYNGSEIKPEVIVTVDEKTVLSSEYEVAYSDNVNAGTASVKVSAKDSSNTIRGEAELNFEIERASKTANNETEFYQILNNQNYYEVIVEKGMTISRDITVAQGKTLRFCGSDAVYNGKTISGTVTVNGTLTIDENAGRISFLKDITNCGTFINKNSALFDGCLSGNGTYENRGKMFLSDNFDVASGCAVNNYGKVIANSAEKCAKIEFKSGGSSTVREPISAEAVRTTKDNYVYNENTQFISLEFDKDVEISTYSRTSRYENAVADTSVIKDVGTVNITVKFNEFSETYYGETVVSCEIKPLAVTVNDTLELRKKIEGNGNYSPITVDIAKVELKNGYPFNEIPSKVELIIGDNCKIVNKSRLTVLGKLTNRGKFANFGYDASIVFYSNGEFANYSEAYFNGNKPIEVSDIDAQGVSYVRKDVNDRNSCQLRTEGVATSVVYGSAEFSEPLTNLKVYLDETELERGINGDYYAPLRNETAVTSETKPATVGISAYEFSKYIYGECDEIATYSITPASIHVNNLQDFITAVNSCNAEAELCNYSEIYVDGNLKDNGSKVKFDVTVCANTTVYMGDNVFELTSDKYSYEECKVRIKGVVECKSPHLGYNGNKLKVIKEDGGEIRQPSSQS